MNGDHPLAQYVLPLRRWWYIVLGVFVLGLVVTWATLPEPTVPSAAEIDDPDATFRATHLLIRDDTIEDSVNFALIELLARQGDLTSRVLDRMEGQVATADVDAIELGIDADLGTIAITTVQPTAELASTLVTTYAEELQEVINERATSALRQAGERISERLPEMAVEIEEQEQALAALPEESLERRLLEAEQELLITSFAAAQSEARSIATRLDDLQTQFDTLQNPSPVASDQFGDDGPISVPDSALPRFVIFGMFAALLGGGLAFGVDYLDTRIRTKRDAEASFGLPVIAELPPRTRREREEEPIPVMTDPGGPTAEAFRALRLSVLFSPLWQLARSEPTSADSVGSVVADERRSRPETLLVTSSLQGDGKSTTVANLAASFAESGQRVLVIDCDFRQSALDGLLGPATLVQGGLRDLDAPKRPELERLIVPTEVPGVSMVRSGYGTTAPGWFVDAGAVLVSHARDLADVVIFDTGPITLTNEAAALIPSVDAVLVVNRAARLTRAQARGTVERLTRLGASVAGIVLIGTDGQKGYGEQVAPSSVTAESEEQPEPVWSRASRT